ncbi:MAG: ParB/RepB/Spo0J family partition protein [Roseburia sp.]|nr:ParB/RepB/Spo0J family partition protein [Roseburia sp.]
MENIINITMGQLYPHPDNPRKDLGDLTELADSIKANGIFQNLTVSPRADGEGYTIIIGHRRHAAAMLAGLTELPCAVVAMTPAEQVKTMLMENMQRADLTVYEQAQGFQMMLDLGGTISSVAADTGFSETTIRRRVKLLELDPKEFKKSEARGVTLFDYMELDKVDDPKEKNKLLKVIGTSDFKAKLEKVLNDQKKAKRLVEIEEFLSGFATKVDKADAGPNEPYTYLSGYDFWTDKLLEKPEDAETREYVFTVNSWGCSLYRKKNQADLDEVAEREARWKQDRAKDAARKAAVDEVSDRCLKLRNDFVMGLSAAACKKLVPVAIAGILQTAIEFNVTVGDDDLKLICPALADDDDLTLEKIINALGNNEQALVRLAYLSAEPGDGYYNGWGSFPHTENEALDMCYDLLTKMGYEMSEEEKQFQDGTHEIFQTEGAE